jgi:hypothetical protein
VVVLGADVELDFDEEQKCFAGRVSVDPRVLGANATLTASLGEAVDFVGQARLLLDQPRLDRDRLAAIPTGMTQKDPRHSSRPQRDPSGGMGNPGQASM